VGNFDMTADAQALTLPSAAGIQIPRIPMSPPVAIPIRRGRAIWGRAAPIPIPKAAPI
jgi:hypothetical protein